MEAQRARALRGSCLQKALRPELRHWVRYGNCLPLEQPAGHRKANCRVAQMHDFHRRPPVRLDLFTLRGGTSLTLSAQYQRAGSRTRHNSAIGWHRSNSGNTHQWMSTPGNSSSKNHDFGRTRGGRTLESTLPPRSTCLFETAHVGGRPQCAPVFSSPVRPAGGTTTVERLP